MAISAPKFYLIKVSVLTSMNQEKHADNDFIAIDIPTPAKIRNIYLARAAADFLKN